MSMCKQYACTHVRPRTTVDGGRRLCACDFTRPRGDESIKSIELWRASDDEEGRQKRAFVRDTDDGNENDDY